MTGLKGKIFDDEINRRLGSSEWSAGIARAVIQKSVIASGEKFFGFASWLVPAFAAAASILLMVTISLSGTGNGNFTYTELYSENTDYTGLGGSEVDGMIDYVYYGRE